MGARLLDRLSDQLLPLESLECCVDRADRGRTTRYALDFSANHCPIGTVAQAEDDQQNDMLELAEILTLSHNICIVDYIVSSVKPSASSVSYPRSGATPSTCASQKSNDARACSSSIASPGTISRSS